MVTRRYFELTHLVERLHRLHLDVLRTRLARLGVRDVTPVQAMLLSNIEGEEILYRELVDRGYYLGSNAAYNVKKLVAGGYLEQERASHDRRAVKLRLTDGGRELCSKLHEMESATAAAFEREGTTEDEMDVACKILGRIERNWVELMRYRRY